VSGFTGDREFRNEIVRLAELTMNSSNIEGLTFSNCRIVGPAVIVPIGSSFLHCSWDAGEAGDEPESAISAVF
jgi:hypothetical protein